MAARFDYAGAGTGAKRRLKLVAARREATAFTDGATTTSSSPP